MNDRFKFRVWDKRQNKYIESPEPTPLLQANGLLAYFKDEKSMENYVIQFCTGLKDKNGKLIYEGDIIVIPNQYPFYDYKNKEEYQNLNETYGEIKGETILNYVGVVEYIFNGWQYVLNCVNPLKRGISNGINHHLNEQGFEEDENSCYEVIGNIYDNKELLDERN